MQQFPYDPNRPVMGSEYGEARPEGWTWNPNIDVHGLYEQEHYIDPATGMIRGPAGPVPAGLGLKWQALHDQAVWMSRYRMAQDALRMAQGATGLMTSYRPGGGAAIQANVHGQMAGVQLQRAQMMQPMDLLGDYRRDQMARVGRKGRKEGYVGTALQGLGAVLSVIPGLNVLGIGLLGAGSAVAGVGQAKLAGEMARAGMAQGMQGGGGGGIGGMNPMTLALLGGMAANQTGTGNTPTIQPSDGLPMAPKLPDIAASTPAAGTGMGLMSTLGQEPVGGNKSIANFQGMQQAGQGMQATGGQQMGKGPSGKMAGPSGPMAVGTDGNFSPMAFAAHGAATSPAPMATQLALSEHLVEQIDNDPSWALLSMAIDKEIVLRTAG